MISGLTQNRIGDRLLQILGDIGTTKVFVGSRACFAILGW
jgi:hypothetical protein